MRCAYSAGALYALAKELHITEPDIFVSVSGSVGTMFYYLTGQTDAGQRIWTERLPSPDFIKYFPLPTIDVDYLIDTVFKKEFPLDEEKLANVKTRWIVPVADTETGETRFIKSDTWLEPYEIMRAAKAAPFLYRKKVRLGGFRAIDGDMTADIKDLIEQAVSEGATDILCITNQKPAGFWTRSVIRAGALFSTGSRRRIYEKRLEPENVFEITDEVRVRFLTPSKEVAMLMGVRDAEATKTLFELGEHDVLAKRGEIEKLFA